MRVSMLRHAGRIALVAAIALGGLFAAFGLPTNAVDARQMVLSALVLAVIGYGAYWLMRSRPDAPRPPDEGKVLNERASADAEWETVQGPLYRMSGVPSRRSRRARIELQERLAVYNDDLEFHVISEAEIPRVLLVLGPARWETADSDEIALELWKSLKSLYLGFRMQWVESGDVNYPVVWRASFRILAEGEDPGEVAVTYQLDADGELSPPSSTPGESGLGERSS